MEETLPDAVAVVSKGSRREPRFKVSLGAGSRSRTFDPGPLMVQAMRSTQVPGGQIAAEVRPVKYVAIGAELDRTLTMHSEVTVFRGADAGCLRLHSDEWPGAARRGDRRPRRARRHRLARVGVLGAGDVADAGPHLPPGHRRRPDLGARRLARRGIRAFGAYEPVVGGDDEMDATRTGFEVGGAIEVAATPHVFVVGEGGFQRFTSSWENGSATDDFPSATLSMGAMF